MTGRWSSPDLPGARPARRVSASTMKPSLVGRLMLAYAVVLAAVLVSSWWGLHSLSEAERAAQRLSDRSVQGLDLAAKLETLVRDKSRLADYLLSGDQATLDAIRPHRAEFSAWFDEMGSLRADGHRARAPRRHALRVVRVHRGRGSGRPAAAGRAARRRPAACSSPCRPTSSDCSPAARSSFASAPPTCTSDARRPRRPSPAAARSSSG